MNHKLLVAVDGTRQSLRTARYAARAAGGNGSSGIRIVVFHVLPRLPPHVESGKAAEAQRRAKKFGALAFEKAEQMVDRVKAQIIREGVPPQAVTAQIVEEEGDVPGQILQAAARHRCDTIVVGHHEKSVISHLLEGSVDGSLKRKPHGHTIWVVK